MALDTLGKADTSSAEPPGQASIPAFELKSATLSLVAVLLKTADLAALEADLRARQQETPGLFTGDPVVLDISLLQAQAEAVAATDSAAPDLPGDAEPVEPQPPAIDFVAIVSLLERFKLQPVAVKGGTSEQMAAALEAGLVDAPAPQPAREGKGRKSKDKAAEAAAPEVVVREVVKEVEVVREVVREVPAPSVPTLVVDKPLRSGQQVYARGGDLIVLAVVNYGAEVIADGNIHVYAPLRGKAIAGAKGNAEARIFSTCLEAELLSIAGIYRTGETELPEAVRGKAAQVSLKAEKLVMEPLKT
jgi:septum site-determining protein MinC